MPFPGRLLAALGITEKKTINGAELPSQPDVQIEAAAISEIMRELLNERLHVSPFSCM